MCTCYAECQLDFTMMSILMLCHYAQYAVVQYAECQYAVVQYAVC